MNYGHERKTNPDWCKYNVTFATFDFSTLHTTLPRDKLIKRFCNVAYFIFEGENKTHIWIPKNKFGY